MATKPKNTTRRTTTKPKVAFVTGATGFLGSHVARQLVEDEGMLVRALARPTSRLDPIADLDLDVIHGDLDDVAALERGMRGADWVFHVAASVNMWRRRWTDSYRINVQGTRNMVDAALKCGVKRFIYTSSVSTIGKPPPGVEEVDETSTYNMEGLAMTYPHTKYLGELEVEEGIRRGLFACITHPTNILGPGDINVNIGTYLMEAKKGTLVVAPDMYSNCCDVRDVARGHILAAKKGKNGGHYILNGETVTTREFFTQCAELTGGRKPLFTAPPKVLPLVGRVLDAVSEFTGEPPVLSTEMALQSTFKFKVNSDKARHELGYTTRPFKESLRDTYQWYHERGMI